MPEFFVKILPRHPLLEKYRKIEGEAASTPRWLLAAAALGGIHIRFIAALVA